jgi:hypothetical protein
MSFRKFTIFLRFASIVFYLRRIQDGLLHLFHFSISKMNLLMLREFLLCKIAYFRMTTLIK